MVHKLERVLLCLAALVGVVPAVYDGCDCATSATEIDAVNASEFPSIDLTTYGIGCVAHDENTSPTCNSATTANLPAECTSGILPVPSHCNRGALDPLPGWCSQQWCYLKDAVKCERESAIRLAHRHSLYFPNSARYYSYAACGYRDTFFSTHASQTLKGRVLRVGVHHNSGGWMGSYHPSAIPNTRENPEQWYGPIWEFVQEAAATAGFTINITAPDALVSQLGDEWSLQRGKTFSVKGAPHERCPYATSIGHLDLCVGQSTVIGARLALTPYFVYQYNPLYLITEKRNRHEWDGTADWVWKKMTRAFEPFTPLVWGVIICCVFITIVVVTVQERLAWAHPQGWDRDDARSRNELLRTDETRKASHRAHAISERRTTERSSKQGQQGWTLPTLTRRERRTKGCLVVLAQQARMSGSNMGWDEEGGPSLQEHLLTNFFTHFNALFSMDVGYSQAASARVTQLGIGIFFLLIVSSYTANLATVLISESTSGKIQSWQAVKDGDLKICGTEMGSSSARKAYPPEEGWNWQKNAEGGYGFASQSAIWALPDGTCDVWVADYQDLLAAQAENKAHCNKMVVGTEPVSFEPVGLPLTTVGDTARLLTAAFQYEVERGTWQRTLKKSSKRPQPKCGGRQVSVVPKLHISDLYGVFMLLFVSILLGCCCSCWSHHAKNRRIHGLAMRKTAARKTASAPSPAQGQPEAEGSASEA